MSKVTFIFNQTKLTIQCNTNDKMENICLKFASKVGNDINKMNFLYKGENINLNLTFEEQANLIDTNRKEMNILVYEKNNIFPNKNDLLFKSKEIICPKCYENCLFDIKKYKVNLYGCQSGHETKSIGLKEFTNTQKINKLKLVCNNCNNKNNSVSKDSKIFYCLDCKQNLCLLCNSIHNKNHNRIDYNDKDYICNKHNDSFYSYCKQCKTNLCLSCDSAHKNHKIILFRDIFPNIKEIEEEMNKFKEVYYAFKNNITKIIKILNTIIDNYEEYYNIISNIINNFNVKRKNYNALINVNEARKLMNIKNNFEEIINGNIINVKFNELFNIYNQMEFNILLYINEDLNEDEILEYKECFDTFDVNDCGLIDANELINISDSIIKDKKKKEAFVNNIKNFIKKKNNNLVNFEEFLKIISYDDKNTTIDYSSPEILREIFNIFIEENNKDRIDIKTFSKKAREMCPKLNDEEFYKVINEADKDKVGKLTYDEFCIVMKKIT